MSSIIMIEKRKRPQLPIILVKVMLLNTNNVTARSRSGLSLQTSGDRKRPRMQPTIPQMVFQQLI